MRKTAVQLMIFIVLIITLTSCIPKAIGKDDIVGVWVEASYSPSCQNSTEIALIEFLETGKFEARSLPQEYLIWFDIPPEVRRYDTSGQWKLQPASYDPFKSRLIQLKFDPNPEAPRYTGAYTIEIYLTVFKDQMLYTDLDDGIIFTQDQSEWCNGKP
jgi:hypothetical protein